MKAENLQCNICTRDFKSRNGLNKHLLSKKHLKQEKRLDKDEKLLKLQNYKQSIKNSKQEHKEKGTYRCDLCNHNYGSNSDLSKHKRTKKHNKAVQQSDSPVEELCTAKEVLEEE